MLGDFIIRLLVLILGYTYPAFECFKTVEKNKVDIEELRFWCQYWILLALISSFERVGDIFISWLPLYGEMKVVFFVYLWYPKTKGTRHVYETLLKPYIAQHETEIDRKIMELRARAWDFFIFYFHNFAQAGQSTLIQAFQYVLAQSVLFSTAAAAKQPPMEPNVNVKTRSPVETEKANEQGGGSGHHQHQAETQPEHSTEMKESTFLIHFRDHLSPMLVLSFAVLTPGLRPHHSNVHKRDSR
ncbi:hypothetical protein HID58_051974 [Brassica napus]|uniref:HVA22-like protein n=1 Tax=Brassica napus TaxID=3708 RepID=A0ABQ8AAJ3_BRANA|nr:hypothetical protein HID58_051974 [Brassica napus]